MRRLRTKHLTLTIFSLIGLALLGASPAHAFTNVTGCGQTLATPGEYILTTDLHCSGTDGIDIAASDVILHLAGHTIASTVCAGAGISVGSVSRVKIDGGTVSGFTDGIVLAASSSRVTGVTVTAACVFGIALSGVGNQVDTSVVTLSGLDGIGIGMASGTVIRNNDISDNARVGVDISNFSNDNVVANNIINRNGIRAGQQGGVAIFNGAGNRIENNALNNNVNGIEIESPHNTVSGNTVSGSASTGIFVVLTASSSTVTLNTVLGSASGDLSDDSATCSGNVWKNNTFQTDFAGGVPNGGPGVGCIQ